MLLKTLRVRPIYFQKLFAEGKFWALTGANCRCVCTSWCVQRGKGSRKGEQEDQSEDIQRMKLEAPVLFRAVKPGGQKPLNFVGLEPPFVFKPIRRDTRYLKDDVSHLGQKKQLDKKEHSFIVQPKFSKKMKIFSSPELRLAEAKALIESVHSWSVYEGCIEPIRKVDNRFYFGSGKVLELSEYIRDAINNNGVTMVFVNAVNLTWPQIKQLEEAWGCKVFDRHRVVLELFKEKAVTKEAKLQVKLAELQFKRARLLAQDESKHYDQQRGGGAFLSGGGEKYLQKTARAINAQISTAKKELEDVKKHKKVAKDSMLREEIPHVAIIGYTNAGKTSLAALLTKDIRLEGKNILFATLDSSVHRGRLPCGVPTAFVDTVGFISDMPHELIDSFTATLQDIKTADVLIHVMDGSHPDVASQKDTVNDVLKSLEVPELLMKNMVEVVNKVDIRRYADEDGEFGEDAIKISTLDGTGVEELRSVIEEKVLQATGREKYYIRTDEEGSQRQWLERHAVVLDVKTNEDCATFTVHAILNQSAKGKFEYQFSTKLVKDELS